MANETDSWMMNLYVQLVVNQGDSRTKGWLLIDSPIEPFIIVLTYIIMVTMVGPTLMENRKPFQLKRLMMAYNIMQVLFCLTFIFNCGILLLINENHFCMELITEDRRRNQVMADLGWWYYMMKYLDLLDTVFFVLTKKFEHISFLHLFHHTSMIGVMWFGIKYIPSGAGAVIPYINTWVHACMYTYYFCSLYFGKVDLLFKKLMTLIQLGQFVISAVMWTLQLLNPYCTFPKWMLVGMIAHASSFIYLFSMFYYNAYIKPKVLTKIRKE